MKTSMSGTTVSDIPVKILAVVDGFYWGKLIMFESTDPAIADIGGIAAGMSGSPVYVNVDGTDRIVGAVSYGDWFTLRGTGLATPIEYMTSLQDQYAAAQPQRRPPAVKLDRAGRHLGRRRPEAGPRPRTDSRPPRPARRSCTRSPWRGSPACRAGAPPTASSPPSSRTAASPCSPARRRRAPPSHRRSRPGSPCGVVFSTGRYALSVLGTSPTSTATPRCSSATPSSAATPASTSASGRSRAASPEPPSTPCGRRPYTPYKMMTPADAKGVAIAGPVRRRAWPGSAGVSATFPVTTHGSRGRRRAGRPTSPTSATGSRSCYWPGDRRLLGRVPGITTYTAAAGLYHALGSDPLVGSATTTTTVVVSDGTRRLHDHPRQHLGQQRRRDLAGSGRRRRRRRDHHHGERPRTTPTTCATSQVKSVDVTADFSSTRRYAGIVDVDDPAGHPRRRQPGRRDLLPHRVDRAADHARHAGRARRAPTSAATSS